MASFGDQGNEFRLAGQVLFHPDGPDVQGATVRAGERARDLEVLTVFGQLRDHGFTGKNLSTEIQQELIGQRGIIASKDKPEKVAEKIIEELQKAGYLTIDEKGAVNYHV